jgi:hypothetical protein
MSVIGDPQHTIGTQALAALGLPAKRCVRLTLDFQPNSIVVATAEYAAEEADIRQVVEIMKKLAVVDESVKHNDEP